MTAGTTADPAQAYLTLASHLFSGQTAESELPAAVQVLPPLDQTLLETLAGEAQQAAWSQPRRSWAIMATADAAAQQTNDLFLKSLAAWHLAYAANAWVRPQRVEAAVARAREGFAMLGRDDWLAACTWQLNALPWTRPDFKRTVAELTETLATLQHSRLSAFMADCRLSLAFAHLLVGSVQQAAELTNRSTLDFDALGHVPGKGRCHLTHSSILRRKGLFDKAYTHLTQALALFDLCSASYLRAQALYQMGFLAWFFQVNTDASEQYFKQAIEYFVANDIPLWQALCLNGLAQLYNNAGNLEQAEKSLQQARAIYQIYRPPGPQADNLLDSGLFEFLKGHLETSITYFSQAAYLYREIGHDWMSAVALMHQGEAHLYLGHYQTALALLEKAHDMLKETDFLQRLAACTRRLAQAWLIIGKQNLADELLQQTIILYKQSGRMLLLPEIYNARALIRFEQNKTFEAIEFLREALQLAEHENRSSQRALAHRLLGEIHCAIGALEQAAFHLQLAQTAYDQMEMPLDQAACRNTWGRYHMQMRDFEAAHAVWNETLVLCKHTFPELIWQAHYGLANLAQERKDADVALEHYRQAIDALSRLRSNLWQPVLAGSYLHKPAVMLEQAIALANEIQAVPALVTFVEEAKAQTVAYQWSLPLKRGMRSEAIEKLEKSETEIRWLQQKICDSVENTPVTSTVITKLYTKLVEKAQQYDDLCARLERAESLTPVDGDDGEPPHSFALPRFRDAANDQLGDSWLALNFFQTIDGVYRVLVTPQGEDVSFRKSTSLTTMALKKCTSGGPDHHWSQLHLTTLGEWLLPDSLWQQLTPNTILLISPHRQLHRLPWAALNTGSVLQSLVEACVPVITPSLRSLLSLWQRPVRQSTQLSRGLVLAVTDFQQRHRPLQAVSEEAAFFEDELAATTTRLHGQDATTDGLKHLRQKAGCWEQFDFLHLATHAFPDQLTGRLSGLALADRDIWIDELWQLTPLPQLITLSACSGLASQIYEGDEPVGLTITCLAAGARHVVGSLRPVADFYAPRFIRSFYTYLTSGERPARALALAQRKAKKMALAIEHWGGFQCVGSP
jgi:CHAT domain-containing protein